ncbi:MAG: hypothetical protein HYW25_00115 [Candidatus Aenigmarchaeota archaeon]|nr:hypothetical protein [Candidatus Aenigmarchaeota archaeon]
MKGEFLKGKRVKRRLNKHVVTVILPPGKQIPYDEGVRRMREIVAKMKG